MDCNKKCVELQGNCVENNGAPKGNVTSFVVNKRIFPFLFDLPMYFSTGLGGPRIEIGGGRL